MNQQTTPNVDDLVASGQRLVHSLARQIHRKFNGQFDLDDLISSGQIGCLQAAQEFDPAKGARFTTYAHYRIRGAIYEGLSKLSWTSRAQYKRLKFQQAADNVLENGQKAQLSDPSVSQNSDWFIEVSRQLAAAAIATHVNLGDAAASLDSAEVTPEELVERAELRSMLRQVIESLHPEHASLIRMVYFEGMSLKAAGEKLGISRSWACRQHASALDRLALGLRKFGIETENGQ